MNRLIRRGIRVGSCLLLLLLAAACGSSKLSPTPNVAQQQGTAVGAALKAFGYTPVYQTKAKGHVSTLYVICHSGNVTTCAHLYAELATNRRPDVYVVGNRITQLQGPARSSIKGGRSPYVNIPAKWATFSKLSAAKRRQLLGIMSRVIKALADGVVGQVSVILIPHVGQTTAYWKIASYIQ